MPPRAAGDDPVNVYLAGLDNPKTKSTMRSALDTAAVELGARRAHDIRWASLREADVRGLRARLGQRCAPGTVNKVLSAIRGAAREAMRLGLLDAAEYAKIAEIGGIRGVRRAERPAVRARGPGASPEHSERQCAENALLVAHELRQPVNAIALHARLIERAEDSGPAARAAAQEITRSTRRLTRLIQDLLDLSHLDTHELSLRPARVDLGDLARASVDELRLEAPEVEVEAQIEGAFEVLADPDRVSHALCTILAHAAEHGARRVRVAVEALDAEVAVTVTSDGEPDAESDLLPREGRSPDHAASPAPRLGLYLARELIAAHGGHFGAEDHDGERTMRFTLPLARRS